jgi:hypothetical protein
MALYHFLVMAPTLDRRARSDISTHFVMDRQGLPVFEAQLEEFLVLSQKIDVFLLLWQFPSMTVGCFLWIFSFRNYLPGF